MNPERRASLKAERPIPTAGDHARSVRSVEPKTVWLSLEEVGAQLGLVRATIYRLGMAGSIPMFRLARNLKMRQADVDLYVERARVVPTPEPEAVYVGPERRSDRPTSLRAKGSDNDR